MAEMNPEDPEDFEEKIAIGFFTIAACVIVALGVMYLPITSFVLKAIGVLLAGVIALVAAILVCYMIGHGVVVVGEGIRDWL